MRCCPATTSSRLIAGLLLVSCSSPMLAFELPPIVLEVVPGPMLPAIASDLRSVEDDGGFVVLLPELDAAIMYRTTGDDTLEPSELFPAGGLARFASFGDIDGDGLEDLVTTTPTTGRAHILLQADDGSYELGAVLPVGDAPFAPALFDLDGDALPELFIPLRGESKIAILPNLGMGLFGAGIRVDCALQPDALSLKDFDLDGTADLAVTCSGASRIQVFFGTREQDSVEFVTAPVELATGNGPVGLVVDDLDGDGSPDLATACTGAASVAIFYSGPGRTFESGPYLFAGTSPQSLVSIDLDQNGVGDLVAANPSTQTMTVLQNQGDREFLRSIVSMPFRPSRLGAADFDDDGRVDLFASSQTTVQTRLLRNTTYVASCVGDVSGDLRINLQDLNIVLANFGSAQDRGDANDDGLVNLIDLNLVLANFGTVCGER